MGMLDWMAASESQSAKTQAYEINDRIGEIDRRLGRIERILVALSKAVGVTEDDALDLTRRVEDLEGQNH